MVLEEEGDKLTDASREHLQRIRASSVRMDGLIDGLLSLSRLTRATRNDAPVNLTDLARGIVAELCNPTEQATTHALASMKVCDLARQNAEEQRRPLCFWFVGVAAHKREHHVLHHIQRVIAVPHRELGHPKRAPLDTDKKRIKRRPIRHNFSK